MKKTKQNKDPKRVEAGRKLAMYNKKSKADKKKVEEQQEKESFSEQKSYFPPLVQISIILGIGLTLINIIIGYKQLNLQLKNHFIEKTVIEKSKQPQKVTFRME